MKNSNSSSSFHKRYKKISSWVLFRITDATKIPGTRKVLTDNRYQDQEQDRGGVRSIIIPRIN